MCVKTELRFNVRHTATKLAFLVVPFAVVAFLVVPVAFFVVAAAFFVVVVTFFVVACRANRL